MYAGSLTDFVVVCDGMWCPRTEDDSETSSDSEPCDSETTECPDSETHPIQKLVDSETTGCPDSETPSIQKLADSETIRFRNWQVGGGDLMTCLCGCSVDIFVFQRPDSETIRFRPVLVSESNIPSPRLA